ncbi:MAG: glycosyltransferase [Pirellulaceae bacterium]
MRNLRKWLLERLPRYDVVYCDFMRDESAMVVELARRLHVPCVVRCGALMGANDIVWQASLRSRQSIFQRCLAADAIIAPRASAQQGLLAAGAKSPTIVRIADGIGDPLRRTKATIAAARKSLAEVNHDLNVPVDGRVLLCMNRLSPEGGVSSLLASIWPVLDQRPDDRLWLIGDGSWRAKIFSEIKGHGIGRSAFMPGSFDHIDELMHAADVFVLPSASDGVESFWPTAIAAGLPSVVVDCPDTRAYLGGAFSDTHHFAAQDVDQLQFKLHEVLEHYDEASIAAERLRKRLAQTTPLSDSIARHVRLFQSLAAMRDVSNVGGATG